MTSKLHSILKETTPIPTPIETSNLSIENTDTTTENILLFLEEECKTFSAYKTLIHQNFHDWKQDSDFLHFDNSYTTYQMLRPQSRELRRQAKTLIEQAARLELLENTNKNQVNQILPKLIAKGFGHQIEPLIQNKRSDPPPPVIPNTVPSQQYTKPTPFLHRSPKRPSISQCYRCKSYYHTLKDCPHYYCRNCHHSAPGHYHQDCDKTTNTTK